MGNASTKLAALQRRIEELEKLLPKNPDLLDELQQLEKQRSQLSAQTWHREGSRLSQVKGLEDIRIILNAACVLPGLQPHLYKPQGHLDVLQRILLYGPPGTGKTLLAESAATDSQAVFMRIEVSKIGSKWAYETDNRIRAMFMEAANHHPKKVFLFMDEIDSLGRQRHESEQNWERSIKNTLLQELDRLPANVIFVGCSNFLDELDTALLRRFDLQLYVRLPGLEARIHLIQQFTQAMDVKLDEAGVKQIAEATELYSGADLGKLLRKAQQVSLERWMKSPAFKLNPEGKYVTCSAQDPAAEHKSLIQLPPGTAAPPEPMTKQDILATIAIVPASSTIQNIIRGAPAYMRQKILDEAAKGDPSLASLTVDDLAKKDLHSALGDSSADVFKLARTLIDQPVDKLQVLTEYMRASSDAVRAAGNLAEQAGAVLAATGAHAAAGLGSGVPVDAAPGGPQPQSRPAASAGPQAAVPPPKNQ